MMGTQEDIMTQELGRFGARFSTVLDYLEGAKASDYVEVRIDMIHGASNELSKMNGDLSEIEDKGRRDTYITLVGAAFSEFARRVGELR